MHSKENKATFSALGRFGFLTEPVQSVLLIPNFSIIRRDPITLGIIDAADNWVVENYKDFARLPNENEWRRLLTSPLNGQIGMSFAFQWRYNFSRVFRDN